MKDYCVTDTLERARTGDLEAVYEIYTANKPLIWKIAQKFSHIDNAISLEDLLQEGFFAIVDAVKTYDAARGNWQTALNWELKRRFEQAIPTRRRKTKMISLDTPTGEDESSTLGGCLADERVVIDGELLQEDFKSTVHRLIKERTDTQTVQILMAHDIAGEPLQDVAERLELSYQAMCTKRRMAILHLARYEDLRQLYRDSFDIEALTYKRSAEEAAVLLLDDPMTTRGEGGWMS